MLEDGSQAFLDLLKNKNILSPDEPPLDGDAIHSLAQYKNTQFLLNVLNYLSTNNMLSQNINKLVDKPELIEAFNGLLISLNSSIINCDTSLKIFVWALDLKVEFASTNRYSATDKINIYNAIFNMFATHQDPIKLFRLFGMITRLIRPSTLQNMASEQQEHFQATMLKVIHHPHLADVSWSLLELSSALAFMQDQQDPKTTNTILWVINHENPKIVYSILTRLNKFFNLSSALSPFEKIILFKDAARLTDLNPAFQVLEQAQIADPKIWAIVADHPDPLQVAEQLVKNHKFSTALQISMTILLCCILLASIIMCHLELMWLTGVVVAGVGIIACVVVTQYCHKLIFNALNAALSPHQHTKEESSSRQHHIKTS